MRPLRTTTALIACVLLALACQPAERPAEPTTEGPAPAAPEPPARKGKLSYEPEESELLLQLSYEGGMIADPDPTPFVRVYSDGRVRVHYPVYMKRAGDYEIQLSSEELDRLLASFAEEGVLTLEPQEIQQMTASLRAEMEPMEIPDDHGVVTKVQIRADSFTPEGEETPTLTNLERELVAPNAALRAAPPGYRRLQELADGVQELEDLARRDDLQPVRDDG